MVLHVLRGERAIAGGDSGLGVGECGVGRGVEFDDRVLLRLEGRRDDEILDLHRRVVGIVEHGDLRFGGLDRSVARRQAGDGGRRTDLGDVAGEGLHRNVRDGARDGRRRRRRSGRRGDGSRGRLVAGVVTTAAAVVGGGESAVVVGSLLQALATRLQATPRAVNARTVREWFIGCSFEVMTGGTRRRSHRRHAPVAALQQR